MLKRERCSVQLSISGKDVPAAFVALIQYLSTWAGAPRLRIDFYAEQPILYSRVEHRRDRHGHAERGLSARLVH